jgi:hypothetical protein
MSNKKGDARREYDLLTQRIAKQFGGTVPSVDEIGPPAGEPFARLAKQLVEAASVYDAVRTLSHKTLAKRRKTGAENPLLASTLLFHHLIGRLINGDETAKIAVCLLSHIRIQTKHATDVGLSMLGSGGGVPDGNLLAWYGRAIQVIDRVDELLKEGASKTKAYRQVAKEFAESRFTAKKVRTVYEGRRD